MSRRASTPADPGPDEDRVLTSPGERYGARLRPRSSANALLTRVIAQETSNLSEALRSLQQEGSLQAAAQAVVAARRRYVASAEKSWAYAALLATDLSASMAHVHLVDGNVVRPVDVLCDVRATDVLVAFSLRRYAGSTLAIAEEFRAAGGSVVGITDAADSPLAEIANVPVVVSTSSASYADSPTAVAAVVHILATLSAASAKGARRRLARRDEVARRLDSYREI